MISRNPIFFSVKGVEICINPIFLSSERETVLGEGRLSRRNQLFLFFPFIFILVLFDVSILTEGDGSLTNS